MKIFKKLTVKVPHDEVANFVVNLTSMLNNGWRRDEEKEMTMKPAIAPSRYYIFICVKKTAWREAALFLIDHGNGILSVANIVPHEVSELSMDEYNAILHEFNVSFITPLALEKSYTVTETPDITSLEKMICKQTDEALKDFSMGANKSTGSAHPYDKERWYDFVISAYTNRDNLSSHMLERWLTEEEGWPAEEVIDLIIEYEQELGLLKRYNR